ncbi:peptidase domain-containing ABC transporter [Daejeonella sp.]|uniref:peptidase domain-containing ABC transporter n=1 Tax=Daejeonella sp. TaxID=2805397 RepID=UPI0039837540
MDIKLKQQDRTDCGAACLASVARYYNLELQIAEIRQRAGTDREGTNVLGMIEAAESFGFEAKGVKASFETLFTIPLPAISHMEIKGKLHHFVVISKITKDHVKIMDPCDGEFHRMTRDEFKKEWTGVLILIVPAERFPPKIKSVSTAGRFWELIRPHCSILVLALFGALVYTVLGLSTSIFIQKIVDQVLVERNYGLLNLMGISMIFLLILKVLIGVAKDIFILRTGQLLDSRLILGYYKHLLRLPQHFFDTMRIGEITSRIGDAVKIRVFINDVSINLIIGVFMLFSSFVLMFTYYWKLALIMFLIVPIYSLIYFITNRLNRKSQRKLMEDSAELESQLFESLNVITTIKRFALERYTISRTESRFITLLKTVYRSGLNSLFSGSSTAFTSHLFTIILLWYGSALVLRQQISPGELLSFYTLIGYFTAPVSSFVGMNKIVQDAIISADRLFEIMNLKQEPEVSENQIELNASNIGALRFNDLTFKYGSRGNVFSNLNLEISLAGMTGIVGESGSGKSTLVALLQNIYPTYTGNISVGDYSIKDITNNSLRKIIAVVPQVTELFSTSILRNIAVGKEEIDVPKVAQICAQLGIMSFIEELPEGFQTNIGEKGVTLSGGQKQRIAIARALYRDPEILILDEATSSLDPKSERFVQDTVSRFLKEGKTIIIIAHRLSSIKRADKIIVLKEGIVKEEGTHSELMTLKSEYYEMWNRHMYA